MENLTVLVFDQGARGHVLSCAYEKSPQVKKIIVAPGNDFIAYRRQKKVLVEAGCSLKDSLSLLAVAEKYRPDLIDVAQDDALAGGTVNLLRQKGFFVFGPTKEAAQIEWDKKWSREFMQKYNIPLPSFSVFDNEGKAKKYLQTIYEGEPQKIVYIKAIGLCSGKGALKAENLAEAEDCVKQMSLFGDAGKQFLIESACFGEEFSVYALSDGQDYFLLKSAQDHKRALNFDQGEQTGGMGTVSPALVTKPIISKIEEKQVVPAIKGMSWEGRPYCGLLYLGGIAGSEELMTIEYNARWGDPEAQVVVPAIKSDYVNLVQAAILGKLREIKLEQDEKTRICVVGAAKGYPGNYKEARGKKIFGLEDAIKTEGVSFFSAAIKINQGKFYADGGRLFSVVGEGRDLLEAKERAYLALARINIEGNNLHYRTDIGWRDLDRILQ